MTIKVIYIPDEEPEYKLGRVANDEDLRSSSFRGERANDER